MKTLLFSIAALSLMGALLIGAGNALSDYDGRYSHEDDDDRWEHMMRRSTGVYAKPNPTYAEECGSCHIAYPPGLLPADSWRRIMSSLQDHFGDNAELDQATNQEIMTFLLAHAADNSSYRRSQQLMTAVQGASIQPPLRITDNPYFRHEHHEVSPRLLKQSGAVSMSHCNACHQRAEQGSFSEREIVIKGIGRWDD